MEKSLESSILGAIIRHNEAVEEVLDMENAMQYPEDIQGLKRKLFLASCSLTKLANLAKIACYTREDGLIISTGGFPE